MKQLLVLITAAALAGVGAAQTAPSQAGAATAENATVKQGSAGAGASANGSAAGSQMVKASGKSAKVAGTSRLKAGTVVQAELLKPLDARKNKPGDEVLAKTIFDVRSEGRIVIPRGSKLIGHVTEVKEHSKQQADAQLGIAFDHALLKDGTQIPLALTIQAVTRPRANLATTEDDPLDASVGGPAGAHRSRRGGLVSGAESTVGDVIDSAGNATGAVSDSTTAAASLPRLSVSAQASAAAGASVISSKNSNLHLDSGTELMMKVSQ